MTLTLRIDPNLERELREQAARIGLDPDSYAVAAIQERIHRDRTDPLHLSQAESELLQDINLGFSEEFWTRYDELVSRRENEILTPQEHQELISLTNQVEQRNVGRIESLAKLARLRNTSLDAIIRELGIKPRSRGNTNDE